MKTHYDSLQISPSADHLVIGKVYRVLAAMYHPDNQETGDAQKFREIREAYAVLSNPALRRGYDEKVLGAQPSAAPTPSSEAVEEVPKPRNQIEMRNLILRLLYEHRIANPYQPTLGLQVIAAMIGVEMEDLEFSRWYLLDRAYITTSSSANMAITSSGVDHVESQVLDGENQNS